MKSAAAKSAARCCVCHRCLKNPEAIALGMGSVCAFKTGHRRPGRARKARIRPLFDLKEQTLGVPLFDLEAS